jgi:O-antigen/teichoic acid export membrane protein
MDNKIKSLGRVFKASFILLFISMIISRGIEFLLKLVLSRVLSPEQLGMIQKVETYFEIIIVIAVFGINTAILKFVSEDSDNNKIKIIITWLVKKSILISTILMLVLCTLTYSNIIPISPNINSIYFLFFTVPLFVFSHPSHGLVMSLFNAQSNVNKMSIYKIVYYLLLFILAVPAIMLWGFQSYFIVLTVLILLMSGYSLNIVRKLFINKASKPKNHKSINSFILYSALSNTSSIILNNLDILMVTFLFSDKEVGYYTVAFLIMKSLWVLPLSIMQIEIPKVSFNYKNNSMNVLEYYKKFLFKMIKINWPIIIIVLLMSRFLLTTLFGDEYLIVNASLKILLVGTLFYSFTIVGGAILLATNNIKINLLLSIARGITLVLLTVLSVHFYGLEGVALGSSTTYIIFFILQTIIFKKIFKRGY